MTTQFVVVVIIDSLWKKRVTSKQTEKNNFELHVCWVHVCVSFLKTEHYPITFRQCVPCPTWKGGYVFLWRWQEQTEDTAGHTGKNKERQTYLGAQGWDDPLQPRRLCFHPSTPRMDPRLSPPSSVLLLSSVCSHSPPYHKPRDGLLKEFIISSMVQRSSCLPLKRRNLPACLLFVFVLMENRATCLKCKHCYCAVRAYYD